MGTQKKEKYIHMRINEKEKARLLSYCDEHLTTPSKLIRKFINDILNEKG